MVDIRHILESTEPFVVAVGTCEGVGGRPGRFGEGWEWLGLVVDQSDPTKCGHHHWLVVC